MMKAKGIVDKISRAVKKEIREKWMNLDEDSKLEYKKEARDNYDKYANLSHNIPRKSRKVSLYTRCAPNRVRLMALNLNERQRFVIREMGFGSMLDLRSIQLDRDFCKWNKIKRVDVSIAVSAEEINHICQQHGLNVVGDIPINLLEGVCKYKERNCVGVNGCLLFLILFYFKHVNVEMNLEYVSKRLQPHVCYWGKKEVNQRMLKFKSIGSFDSPKLVVTQMDGGHEIESIPLEKQDINESHAMPSQHEDKRNMGFDEAIHRIEQSITSLRYEMLVMQKTVIDQSITCIRDEMLVMQKTVTNIANNMDTFKNDILLELKKTTREHSEHSNDLNLNDIVDVKKEMKPTSPYIIQDTMDQDDTICAKDRVYISSSRQNGSK
nr:hypothetical protein CFP56_59986 [Quercus suber]